MVKPYDPERGLASVLSTLDQLRERLGALADRWDAAFRAEQARELRGVLSESPTYPVHDLVTEHAVLYAGGSMLVRPNDPVVERVCPLAEWIEAGTDGGSRVYRRTVIVVDDWVEVNPRG